VAMYKSLDSSVANRSCTSTMARTAGTVRAAPFVDHGHRAHESAKHTRRKQSGIPRRVRCPGLRPRLRLVSAGILRQEKGGESGCYARNNTWYDLRQRGQYILGRR
jgi:hypothetical protein